MVRINAVLSEAIVKELDTIAREEDKNRSELLREAAEKLIEEHRHRQEEQRRRARLEREVAGKLEMTGYVLDTSVIIKWFSTHGEEDLESALRLRDGLVSGNCTAVVPDLLFYELANALRYNPNFNCDDAKDAVAAVNDMGFAVRCADPASMARAIEMAVAFNVTVNDAYF